MWCRCLVAIASRPSYRGSGRCKRDFRSNTTSGEGAYMTQKSLALEEPRYNSTQLFHKAHGIASIYRLGTNQKHGTPRMSSSRRHGPIVHTEATNHHGKHVTFQRLTSAH
ncbi:conjugative relaxase domain protein, TrwC/TraI family [Anopheles sinensis]|uniref:Conjugative relaxase domain protein, TrwC/TraI family n=1 Tax=Anopheles sinensis TaxID=74873 RepID=A0A084VDT8_ANOSI|nr:conjugative relaxase domain protein, TrwC/TraI family [Anopheles sinensis]